MTKYEELAQLSNRYSKQFYAMNAECKAFAQEVVLRFADFLEAPDESLTYVDILPDLEFGDAKMSVRHSRPTMTYGPDGYWYFGVRFNFVAPDSTHYFGEQFSLF